MTSNFRPLKQYRVVWHNWMGADDDPPCVQDGFSFFEDALKWANEHLHYDSAFTYCRENPRIEEYTKLVLDSVWEK